MYNDLKDEIEMKTRFALFMILPLAAIMISGCEKEKEEPSVTLGAQSNTTVPGYYSLTDNKTYTMSQAADNADAIDISVFTRLNQKQHCSCIPGFRHH